MSSLVEGLNIPKNILERKSSTGSLMSTSSMDDTFMLSNGDTDGQHGSFAFFSVPPPTPAMANLAEEETEHDPLQQTVASQKSASLEPLADRGTNVGSSGGLRRSFSHGSAPALVSGRKTLVVRGRGGNTGRRNNQHARRRSASGLPRLSLTAINEAFVVNAKDPMLSPCDDEPESPVDADGGLSVVHRITSYSSSDVSMLQHGGSLDGLASLTNGLTSSSSIYEQSSLEEGVNGAGLGIGMDGFVGGSFVDALEAAATLQGADRVSNLSTSTSDVGEDVEAMLLAEFDESAALMDFDSAARESIDHSHYLALQNRGLLPPSPQSSNSSQHFDTGSSHQSLIYPGYTQTPPHIAAALAYGYGALTVLPPTGMVPGGGYTPYTAGTLRAQSPQILRHPSPAPTSPVVVNTTGPSRASPYPLPVNPLLMSRSRTRSVPAMRLQTNLAASNNNNSNNRRQPLSAGLYPVTPGTPNSPPSPMTPISPTISAYGSLDNHVVGYGSAGYPLGLSQGSSGSLPTLHTANQPPQLEHDYAYLTPTTPLHGRLKSGRHSTSSLASPNYVTHSAPHSRQSIPRVSFPRTSSTPTPSSDASIPHVRIDDLIREHDALVAQVAEAQKARRKEDEETSKMIETLNRLMGVHGI
ncbi:uncharacterized protein SPPG_06438 [Spizellomyces punctatus DAOM BR117]|uniref:Uncharacterized protein n=1 Tax=Spizellomyces punctatus (strain DAOM BR117) TaxID=645134 RepID=A0A0L0HAU9_SPIPD|nr:uncharacterized protein SPPG_06438 [Spizellomyces punctatus DAOM BR117]KNC98019.1 hypothetical protein SPPG_06438 [Spizellomyces punctatus DAOM BR117]|eukprot:XP_016606059.1 hypothetical protein SPPG_06438 [Spizellomyces punctatus DAOM BR117]